ncbi:Peptidoglycan/LPS O-acetylase OafA/YrhL, contains acyltransferase and SGNH-hydrolase domains [Lentzea albidocapillata subsp. violacea]|uniref:Peptidoglycan/LPS O-acetylase OafA/YrhL, contains acyltransferase and SGNH-hydrolase domains n=1 Tax=Lentzea albidocapillata subsp. violacea TaxID=128104 RepID=A0A1G9RFD1_9PSEU|nr:acyltransferase [Lentzea albidocapillata]SDM22012.1 Peptidoglycan/LPS O-acetylase OafA/YrhL, contains acyltransferase and SGNH-hydrolase domains [Lentzea albidocapillata subsp. violacea]
MQNQGTGLERLPSLTGLRFVAAFVVFGFHLDAAGLWPYPDVPFRQGATGVSFFFILSGFVLTWSAKPDTGPVTVWRRRAAKIFPNHLATWVIVLVAGAAVTPAAALANLSLTQAWFPGESVYFGLNTPAWSLSCELAFYLAFPLLIKWRMRRPWVIAGTAVIAILTVPVVALSMPGAIEYWFVFVFPPVRALEFILGMAMARVVQQRKWIGVGLWPASALFVVAYVGSWYLPASFPYVAGTVIPLALLIPAAAVADLTGRWSPWRSKWMVWLGTVSFAFYMVHQIVIRVSEKLLDVHAYPLLSALGMFVVSMLGAWLLYRLVEVPAERFVRGTPRPARIRRASTRTAPPADHRAA